MKTMTMVMTVLLATAPPCEADSLGRLFFTPAERRALEAGAPDREPTGSAAALRLEGWFDDGRGGRRFWIDGRPLREGQPVLRPRLQGNAVVLEWRGWHLRLRPGQAAVADGTSGVTIEEFAGE